MKISRIQTVILLSLALTLSACSESKKKRPADVGAITVVTIQPKAVTLTKPYFCQLQSHHHIDIRAVELGYLESLDVKPGQAVKEGDLLCEINSKRLFESNPVVGGQVVPFDPKLAKARASADVSAVALNLFPVKAPFDGHVDNLKHPQGTLVQKGETLMTLSDDSQMWAYFSIPEARYLEYKATDLEGSKDELKVELVLSNGKKFDHPGKLGTTGGNFNAETGTIRFRADFPNPDRLLRHGQTGTVLIGQVQKDAIAIPQRAVFEIDDEQHVYVLDKDDVAHRREIVVQQELDDDFVLKSGLAAGDRVVVSGISQVRDGTKVTQQASSGAKAESSR